MAEVDTSAYAYDLAVLDQDGRLLHLPHGSLVWEEQADELAATVTCNLPNVETTEGPMRQLAATGTPAYLYLVDRGNSGAPAVRVQGLSSWGAAWDPEHGGTPGGFGGGRRTELLRGTIVRQAASGDGIELEVTIVDNLATLLKHDVDVHVPADTNAQDALRQIIADWGLELGRFEGPDVTLPELTWRGDTAATVVQDILDQGPKQGAGRFTMRAVGQSLEVFGPGGNLPVVWLRPRRGAGTSRYDVDISDMVGNVVLKTETAADDQDATSTTLEDGDGEDLPTAPSPVPGVVRTEGAVSFNGATKFVYADTTGPEAADLQVRAALAEHGFPAWTFEHETLDVPQVRKWDRLRITDTLLDGYFLVEGVSHDASQGTMRLTLVTPEEFGRKTQLLELQAQLDELKAVEEAAPTTTSTAGASDSAIAKIDAVCRPYMGSPYVWGGKTAGSWDCSGFAFWLAAQLGAPMAGYAYTDSIASVTQLVAKNSQQGAAVGDFVLYWDGGIDQPGTMYPHVSVWIGPGQVIEQGGTARNLHKGGMLGGYSYEIRRWPALYQTLHKTVAAGKGKAA